MTVDDLADGTRRHADGLVESLDYPSSDVLIYRMENRSRVIVRPSGTEPKVKCYYEVVETVGEEAYDTAMQRARAALSDLIEAHQDSLN